MSLLLAIETTSPLCSVSLFSDDREIASRTAPRERMHAELLVPMIAGCFDDSNWVVGDLDYIGLSSGPGSYTGLRIGAASAKGLAWSTGARIVAVPTFEAIAHSLLSRLVVEGNPPNGAIVVTAPSRRNEVYVGLFRPDDDGVPERILDDAVVETTRFASWLGLQGVSAGIITGPGVDRITDEVALINGFRPIPALADARGVAQLALAGAEAGRFEDTSSFEPSYLKTFVAIKPSKSVFDRLPF